MNTHNQPSDGSPAPAPLPKKGVRLWPAVLIVALLLAIWGATTLAEEQVGFAQSFITMSLVGLGAILLSLWFLTFSRLTWKAKLVGCAVALSVAGIANRLVRFESWDGQMWPIFAWRWTPTAEERFANRQDPHVAPSITIGDDDSDKFRKEDESPEFLGPGRIGRVTGLRLAHDWNAEPPREIWRRAVGLGWGSFAVAEGLAVTQEQRGEEEAVVAYELRTGREVWARRDQARFKESLGGDGPRATPTIRDGRVYALGATGLLNCLDLKTGEQVWQRDILKDAGADNITWGMCSAPLVVDNKVIVVPGNQGAPADQAPGGVAAYDAETGDKTWCDGRDRAGYTSPVLAEFEDSSQVVVFSAHGIAGHDLASGNVLWQDELKNSQQIVCATPLVLSQWGYQPERNLVLASSGYGVGSVLLEICREGDSWTAKRVWKNVSTAIKSKYTNLVVHGDYLYGLDEGILVCVDLATGARKWKGGRYKHGQLLLVDDLLLIQAEDGYLALAQATPECFEELARYPVLADRTWNNLCLSGRLLLTRNDREAVCLELPVVEQ